MDLLVNNIGLMAGVSGAGVVLWMLKKVPNKKIASAVEGACFRLGRVVTMFMGSKKSPVGKFWNKTIEPYIIDAIDNIVANGIKSFCDGMRSDN